MSKNLMYSIRIVTGSVFAVSGLMASANGQERTPLDLVAPSLDSAAQGEGQSLLEGLARDHVALQNGLDSAELQVLASTSGRYPLQGIVVREFKIYHQGEDRTFSIALDRNGMPVDAQALADGEHHLHRARYGAMHPDLHDALRDRAEEAVLPVTIWLSEPSYVGPERPSTNGPQMTVEEQDSFFAMVDDQRRAAVSPIVAPVYQRLVDLGIDAEYENFAPILRAELSPTMIETVASWDEVDTIYLASQYKPLLDVARKTINADDLHIQGVNGSGVRIAQIEVGGRVSESNPYLWYGMHQDTRFICQGEDPHATAVAGIMKSMAWPYGQLGIAFYSYLWCGGSCGGWDHELANRASAAADWGARAINCSYGRDDAGRVSDHDKFYDTMIFTRYRTVVVAAGNEGAWWQSGNVTSPATGYNMISVGNYDDNDTVGWSDDRMAFDSSWRDPRSTYGDREKPELAAPGFDIESTTNASPWIGDVGWGTSYAAPMVTGSVALLMQKFGSLTSWPESVKAILMATAVNNIEGSSELSESDGAGGIDVERAYHLAGSTIEYGDGAHWGGLSYTCSSPSTKNLQTDYFVAGLKTRIVLCWAVDPNDAGYVNQPGADIDLWVVDSSGRLVDSSSSWDNNYEIIEFTPSRSGHYTIQARRYRCSKSPQWMGYAYTQIR